MGYCLQANTGVIKKAAELKEVGKKVVGSPAGQGGFGKPFATGCPVIGKLAPSLLIYIFRFVFFTLVFKPQNTKYFFLLC